MKPQDLYVGLTFLNSVGKKVIIEKIDEKTVLVSSPSWGESKYNYKKSWVVTLLSNGHYKVLYNNQGFFLFNY